MSASLRQKLEAIPGVHVASGPEGLLVEPVTEHDLVQALTALRHSGEPVRLSLARMTRMGAVNEAALLLEVEAGATLGAIEELAGRLGMTLGWLPAAVLRQPVGEYLEGPYAGLRAVPCGRLEPVSISLRVVMPDALVTRSPVAPRGAAGPDLESLYLGGERRFGVISGATLRLWPRPKVSQRAAFSFASAGDLQRTLVAVLQDGVVLSRLWMYRRGDRYHAGVHLFGSPASIERDLGSLSRRGQKVDALGAAVPPDDGGDGDPVEHAVGWREVVEALEAGEALSGWRVAVDGLIVRGTGRGRPLVPRRSWPELPGLDALAKEIDTHGVMGVLL